MKSNLLNTLKSTSIFILLAFSSIFITDSYDFVKSHPVILFAIPAVFAIFWIASQYKDGISKVWSFICTIAAIPVIAGFEDALELSSNFFFRNSITIIILILIPIIVAIIFKKFEAVFITMFLEFIIYFVISLSASTIVGVCNISDALSNISDQKIKQTEYIDKSNSEYTESTFKPNESESTSNRDGSEHIINADKAENVIREDTSDYVSTKNNVTVYVTRYGEKYHESNCQCLTDTARSISRSEALNKGYTPCKVCRPD